MVSAAEPEAIWSQLDSADREALGAAFAVFKPRWLSVFAAIVVAVLLLAGGLAILIGFPYEWIAKGRPAQPASEWVAFGLLMCFGIGMVVVAVFFALEGLHLIRWSALLCEHGVLEFSGTTRRRYLWADIALIRDLVQPHHNPVFFAVKVKVVTGVNHFYTLVTRDNRQLSLNPNNVRHVADVTEVLRSVSAAHNIPWEVVLAPGAK